MWETVLARAVFILCVGRAASSSLIRVKQLETPNNLSVGNENQTTVSVYWNMTTPHDVELEKVLFTLRILSHGIIVIEYFIRFEKPPFHHIVTDLEHGSKYTLTLFAECPGWETSEVSRAQFTTLDQDWATPIITFQKQIDTGMGIKYTVNWILNGSRDSLDHMSIEHCDPDCVTVRQKSDLNHATVSFTYNTNFTLRVTAVYDVPVLGFVRRPGVLINETAALGRPYKLEGPVTIEPVGSKLGIEWPESVIPSRPLDFYEIVMVDVRNPFSRLRTTVPFGTTFILDNPKLMVEGHVYEIHIRGVNVDVGGKERKGDFAFFRFRYKIPAPPKVLDVLNMEMNRIRFRVPHREIGLKPLFQIKTEAKFNMLDEREGLAEIVGLLPNQDVKLSVRSCDNSDSTNTLLCGLYFHTKLKSNVGAPSRIPLMFINSVKHTDCIVVLWKEPEEPRGPINGYKFMLTPTHSMYLLEEAYWRPVTPGRKVIFCESNLGKFAHSIGISAFNYDLFNGSVKHVGDPVYRLTFPTERSRGSLMSTVMSTTCVVFMFGAVLTFSVFLTMDGE